MSFLLSSAPPAVSRGKRGLHCLPPLAPGNMISFSNKSGKADRSIEMGVTAAHTSPGSPCGKGRGQQLLRTRLSALSLFTPNLCTPLLLLWYMWLHECWLLSVPFRCMLPCRESGETRKKSWGNWTFFSSPSIMLTAWDTSLKWKAGSDSRAEYVESMCS